MKKTLFRTLLVALLLLAVIGALSACGTSEFTVTVKDGDTTLKTLTLEKEAAITIDPDDTAFQKAGYEVEGIYTDAAFTTPLSGDALATEDLVLYVKYEPRPFKIIVIDDPNSTTYTQVDVTYNGAYSLTAPTRAGYLFLGYTHVQDGAPVSFPLTGTYTKTNTISISAQWKKLASITVYDELSEEQVGTVIYADAEGNFTLPAVTDENAGYNFGGYVIPGVALTRQQDGTYTGKVTSDSSMTATRKWTPIPTHLLTVNGLYDDDIVPPASYKTGETFTLPVAPTRDGYVFTGYTVNGEALTVGANGAVTFTWSEATTVTANWRARVYITVRDERTGATVGTVEVVDGAYDLSALIPAEGDRVVVEADVTYTYLGLVLNGNAFAVSGTNYTGGSVTVTRDWNGVDRVFIDVVSKGAAFDFAPVEVVNGEYTALATPTLSGYYFLGFFTDEACAVAFANDGEYDGTTDLTVYAKWRRVATVNINNGSDKVSTVTVQKDGSFTLPAVSDTDDHYFLGYTLEGLTLTKQADGTYTGTYTGDADVTAYQNWQTILKFNWTLDANGGAFASGIVTSGTAAESTKVSLPTPERDGYTFLGYTYGDGTLLEKDGDLYVLPAYSAVQAKALKLVAKWEISTGATGEQKDPSTGESLHYFREENGGELIYVFLTGQTYWFGTDALTFGGDVNAIEAKQDGDKNGFLAKAPGTFTMTRNGITIKCRVEYYVAEAGEGTNTASRDQANFKATIDTVLDAGIKNFIPDLLAGTVALDKIPFTVTVKKGDEDLVAGTDYTVLPNGAIDFDDDLIGETLTLTYVPVYALAEDNVSASVTVTLNGGVNVYTNDELYAAYSNLNTRVINILRNITAAMQAEHCAHGHPVGCCYEFERLGSDADPVPINEYKHGVYTRTYDKWYDSLTVNGNCYTIDGSKLPKIDGRKKPSAYDGLFEGTGYSAVNVQIGIFTCYAKYDTSSAGTKSPEVTFNDLYIVGNFDGDSTKTEGSMTGGNQLIVGSMSFDGFVVRSGYLNLNNVTMLHMHKAIHSTGFADAPYDGEGDLKAAYTPARLETKVILTDVKITDSFANALFAWGQVQAELYNCEFGQCSGPAIVFSDTDITAAANAAGCGSKLTFGADTTVENYVTGLEAWFQAYGVAGDVGKMEELINGSLAAGGLPAVSKKDGLFNLVLAVNSASSSRFPGTYQEGYEDHYEAPCIDLVFTGASPLGGGVSLFPINGDSDPITVLNPATGDPLSSGAILEVDSKQAGMQLVIQLFPKK